MLVKIMPEAIAGSASNLWRRIRTTIPDKPAAVRLIIVAMANKEASLISVNKK